MGLGDYTLAFEMRSVMERIARSVVNSDRPAYRYATVDSIDRANRKAGVIFQGDDLPVTVSMGSVQPLNTGQIVRVNGIGGDKFIDDVMGPVYNTIAGLADVDLVTNGLLFNSAVLSYNSTTTKWEPNFYTSDTLWNTPTLLGTWTNYAVGYPNVGWRIKDGIVWLRGLVKSGASGSDIFILPAGARPSTGINIFNGVDGVNAMARVDVDGASGRVYHQSGNTGYISLNNIRFPADQ